MPKWMVHAGASSNHLFLQSQVELVMLYIYIYICPKQGDQQSRVVDHSDTATYPMHSPYHLRIESDHIFPFRPTGRKETPT